MFVRYVLTITRQPADSDQKDTIIQLSVPVVVQQHDTPLDIAMLEMGAIRKLHDLFTQILPQNNKEGEHGNVLADDRAEVEHERTSGDATKTGNESDAQ